MNTKLLRRIQKHILAVPRRFIMDDVIDFGSPGDSVYDGGVSFKMPDCGTAACIAGWACVLSKDDDAEMGKAQELLGITPAQGASLFLTDHEFR